MDSWPAVNPSYLAIQDDVLFAALECGDFYGEYGGGAAAYRINPDGSLLLLSEKATHGKNPCHVCPRPDGKKLYVSNYTDGSLSIFDVTNGLLGDVSVIKHTGHGPNDRRQEGPHVHSAIAEPGNKRIGVTDLGIDQVIFYNTDDMRPAGFLETKAGSGPRHIVFSGNARFVWAVCELSSEVYAFESGSCKVIGVYKTLPDQYTGPNTCAAIKLAPDEKRLYVSNRGHDSIACFAIDGNTGELSLCGNFPAYGQNPRDFEISPDGSFLFAANQDSDNITVFRINDGVLVNTGLSLKIPAPVCIINYTKPE